MEEKDNTPSVWAKEAIKWAIDNGVLKGDDQGNYKLQTNITREAALVFMYRGFKAVGLID